MELTKKTIIKRVAGFFIILLAILLVCSYLFEPKNNSLDYRMRNYQAMGFYGLPENSIDVLYLGDSEAYCSISPMDIYEQYGFTSYMCGTDTQKIYISYDILCKFLERQKPKYVVLEANTTYYYYSTVDDLKYRAKEAIVFLNYHNRWKNLHWDDLLLGNVNYTWANPYKGYYLFTAISPTDNDPYMIETEESLSMDSGNKEYIAKIKEKCDEIGAQLIFIASPNKNHWTYQKHNGTLAFCQENGIDFYDLNLEYAPGIDYSTDTFDAGEHVNHAGALKNSTMLGKILTENYNLPDHRGQASYAEYWDDQIESFKQDVINSER